MEHDGHDNISNTEQISDITRRLAALTVRRRCNQHECTAATGVPCRHPNHRRDVDYMHHILEALGLDTTFPDADEHDHDALIAALKNIN